MNKLHISRWALQERILATLAYFDVFDRPLRESDWSKLILGEQNSEEEILQALKQMDGMILNKGGISALKGRNDLIDKIEEKRLKAKAMMEKAIGHGGIFCHIPFVEFVAVCNYLPLDVVDDDSDIDLFIVTKKNRIFLARIFTTIVLHCLRLRRHGAKIKGRYCLSFYVSEDHLDLKDLLQVKDIYFAYWLAALWPIYGQYNIWEELKNLNHEWMSSFFEGNRFITGELSYWKRPWRHVVEEILKGKFGNWVEDKLEKFFQKRNLNKKGLPINASIIVSKTRLKFHNNDRRLFFRKEWEKRLEWLGFLD